MSNMAQVMVGETATKYKMAQYDRFRDGVDVLYLQKKTLAAKLQGQMNFLASLQRPKLQPCIEGLGSKDLPSRYY